MSEQRDPFFIPQWFIDRQVTAAQSTPTEAQKAYAELTKQAQAVVAPQQEKRKPGRPKREGK